MALRSLLAISMIVVVAGCVDPVLDPDRESKRKTAISGDFYCASMETLWNGEVAEKGRCETRLPIRMFEGGDWFYGEFKGTYEVDGVTVHFKADNHSSNTPAGWGDARLDADGLVFASDDSVTTWELVQTIRGGIKGEFVCEAIFFLLDDGDLADPVPCDTRSSLHLRLDGSYDWQGEYSGTYYTEVDGERLFFQADKHGLFGPVSWGDAYYDGSAITFQGEDRVTSWSRSDA